MTTTAATPELRLPRPPGMLRAFWARHPRLTDAAVAAVALVFGYGQTNGVGFSAPLLEQLEGPWFLITVGTSAALLARRRHTLAVLVAVVAGDALLSLLQQVPMYVPAAVIAYTLALRRSAPVAIGAALGGWAVVTGCVLVSGLPLNTAVVYGVFLLIGVLVGANVGNRRRYLGAVLDLAGRLAHERDQQAQLAAAAERSRIARELHDIVAHSLTVVIRLSDGVALVVESDPDRAREASEQIGKVGRNALVDMRRLLGVLRDGDSDSGLAPPSRLSDLDELIGTFRAAGLPVVVQRTGAEDVSDGMQLLVFRAVQEALTNALRYARQPTEVSVSLAFGPSVVDVQVSDDGAVPAPPDLIGARRGLAGLEERAALYGGRVTAGPRTDLDGRGWTVRVTLPRTPVGA